MSLGIGANSARDALPSPADFAQPTFPGFVPNLHESGARPRAIAGDARTNPAATGASNRKFTRSRRSDKVPFPETLILLQQLVTYYYTPGLRHISAEVFGRALG